MKNSDLGFEQFHTWKDKKLKPLKDAFKKAQTAFFKAQTNAQCAYHHYKTTHDGRTLKAWKNALARRSDAESTKNKTEEELRVAISKYTIYEYYKELRTKEEQKRTELTKNERSESNC